MGHKIFQVLAFEEFAIKYPFTHEYWWDRWQDIRIAISCTPKFEQNPSYGCRNDDISKFCYEPLMNIN